jgi:hypothetical protein
MGLSAELQNAWHIDPSAANNRSTGLDASHKIRDCEELERRLGRGTRVIRQPTTITYYGSQPDGDVAVLCNILFGYNATLTLQSTPTVAASGTLTNFTAFNRAAQTLNIVEDTGLAGGFAAHIGRGMRISSGPRAGTYWILSHDLGGGQAEVSSPGSTVLTGVGGTFTRATPQIGDAYQIVTVASINCGSWSFGDASGQSITTNPIQIFALDLELNFGNKTTGTTTDSRSGIDTSVPIAFHRCTFDTVQFNAANNAFARQCRVSGYTIAQPAARVSMQAGKHNIHIAAYSGSYVTLNYDELFDGGAITMLRGGTIEIGTACVFRKAVADNACYIGPGATLVMLPDHDGTALWGTGSLGHGLTVASGGAVACQGAVMPTINAGLGAGREVLLGGVDMLYSDLPATARNAFVELGTRVVA